MDDTLSLKELAKIAEMLPAPSLAPHPVMKVRVPIDPPPAFGAKYVQREIVVEVREIVENRKRRLVWMMGNVVLDRLPPAAPELPHALATEWETLTRVFRLKYPQELLAIQKWIHAYWAWELERDREAS